MASETIKCPHCYCKVLISEVEKEDGYCPECGQLVMGSKLFDDFDDEDDDDLDREFDFDEENEDGDYDNGLDDEEEDDDGYERDILDELNEEFEETPSTRSSKRRKYNHDEDE